MRLITISVEGNEFSIDIDYLKEQRDSVLIAIDNAEDKSCVDKLDGLVMLLDHMLDQYAMENTQWRYCPYCDGGYSGKKCSCEEEKALNNRCLQ